MKRIFAGIFAGLLIGLAGCGTGGSSSSSQASSASPAPSEESSQEASQPSSEGELTEVPPFNGLDPAASLSNEELAATIQAAYEGTGEFAPDKLPTAELVTSMGNIKIRLFPQFAPKAVENFITHAKDGYYNNTKFHRIVKDFMIQGGDPKGDGTGGTSIWKAPFEDEVNDILHNFRGALSMANAGHNTNGSQFFIVQNNTPLTDESWNVLTPSIYMNRQTFEAYQRLIPFAEGLTEETVQSDTRLQQAMDILNAELAEKKSQNMMPEEYNTRLQPAKDIYKQVGGTPHLDNLHTVFGYVYEGMDVVDAIASVEVNGEAPKDNVLVKEIIITEPEETSGTVPKEETSSSSEASQAS